MQCPLFFYMQYCNEYRGLTHRLFCNEYRGLTHRLLVLQILYRYLYRVPSLYKLFSRILSIRCGTKSHRVLAANKYDQYIQISKYIFLVYFDVNCYNLYAECNDTKYSDINEYMCFDVCHSSRWLFGIQNWMDWI
jgi:hypothetical protein